MASTQRKLLRGSAAALALALLSWPAALAGAADTVAFTIQDSRITESSGLARDPGAKLYWTVNDSGGEGTAYGLTPQGQVKGLVGFRANPNDVEAVALHDDGLFIADIGDNRSSRDFVTVYWINNPEPDNQTVPYRAYDFSYPDGAHDAETLLVGGDGRLYIVTKGLPGGIYRAPKDPSRQGVNKLKKVGDAPAFVTDGVFLPDDDKIVLRTYVSVEVLDASTYKTVARAATPLQKQGESIALSLDGSSLLIGSEGKRSSVLEIPIPATMGEAPSANSKPPSTSTPTPSASASPSDSGADDTNVDDDQGSPTSRTGTILALSLAALVAVIAGVVVAAVRKP